MKRKLISAVALILCATMLLFCGCKSKKNNDDSTSPSESGAAVDAITDESTEPSTEGTTEPEKKESTPDAIKKVTDSTKKPGKVNTTTPAVKKDEWKKAGKYTCGKNLAAGEYYIKPDSKNCSVILTDGKHFGKDEIVEFDVLPFGLFVTMKPGYTLEVKNGKFIVASAVEKMGGKNGVYEIGTYRVGIDIPAGEYVIGEFGNTDFSILNSVDFLSGNNYAITYRGLRVYVKLEAGDYIIFNKDTKVVKAKDRTGSYDEKDKSYGGGTYLVGANQDMKAGKYVLVPTDDGNGYSTGAAHIKFSQITGELNVKKDKSIIIELKDGEFISFEGFKLVEYVEPAPNPDPDPDPNPNPNPDPNPNPNPDGNNGGDNNKPDNNGGDNNKPGNNDGENNKPENNAGGNKADENKS